MIGLPSTAATATHEDFVYGCLWHDQFLITRPGSSNCWYDEVWHNKVSFLPKSHAFKRLNLPEKGVICRNWETTHFQFQNWSFLRYDTGDKP